MLVDHEVTSASVEGGVLHAIEQSPGSTRWLAHCHVSLIMVVRVLYDKLLYAFHIQHVQALQLLLDFKYQKVFCDWLMQ
jgi:hypothetical protein